MNTCWRGVLALGLLASTPALWAWSKDYQGQYLLGDNDSRVSARQNALTQIQMQAIKEAGTYIQGSTSLVNDRLQESIEQVSAAVVAVTVLDERFELGAGGQQRLWLSARATVDESVLRQRVQALLPQTDHKEELQAILQDNQQIRRQLADMAQQRQSQQPLLSSLQVQQQQLAAENLQLRQQLHQVLEQHPAAENPLPAVAVATAGQPVVVGAAAADAEDVQVWFPSLYQAWRQTPVAARVLARKAVVDDGQSVDMLLGVDWHLGLTSQGAVAELCRHWRCVLGYAYKAPFDDTHMTPLHQQLFRPVSRLAHIDDKYVNHWLLLTLQAYPPQPLTAAQRDFLLARQLRVRVSAADQSREWPLLRYDAAEGALVLNLQGPVNMLDSRRYDSVTRTGGFMCAMEWSGGVCAGGEATQYLPAKVRTAAAQQSVLAEVEAANAAHRLADK